MIASQKKKILALGTKQINRFFKYRVPTNLENLRKWLFFEKVIENLEQSWNFSEIFEKSISDLFPTMFPETPTAESLQMGPEKLYVVKFVIAPFFKQLLLKDKVSESESYLVSFDESFNDFTLKLVTRICQLGIGLLCLTKLTLKAPIPQNVQKFLICLIFSSRILTGDDLIFDLPKMLCQ